MKMSNQQELILLVFLRETVRRSFARIREILTQKPSRFFSYNSDTEREQHILDIYSEQKAFLGELRLIEVVSRIEGIEGQKLSKRIRNAKMVSYLRSLQCLRKGGFVEYASLNWRLTEQGFRKAVSVLNKTEHEIRNYRTVFEKLSRILDDGVTIRISSETWQKWKSYVSEKPYLLRELANSILGNHDYIESESAIRYLEKVLLEHMQSSPRRNH
jgi:hypothetical protein